MNKRIDNISILIQTMLSFFIILFGFLALYIDQFLIGTQALLSINMMLIAYNSYKQTHNKFFSTCYIIMGIICLGICGLLMVR